jgi:hypothetical protein
MLDDSDFRLGQKGPMGPMRVTEADASYKAQKDQPLASEQAKKKGTGANRDRQKIIKKNQEMNKYVLSSRRCDRLWHCTNYSYAAVLLTGTTMIHQACQTPQAGGIRS